MSAVACDSGSREPSSREPSSAPSSAPSTPCRSAAAPGRAQTSPLRDGSGWGGVRTPTDDFISQRRRSLWCDRTADVPALPPRVYVDNKTLIREVTDLTSLRRGEHCLIAINLLIGVHPMIDWLISFLGSIELFYFYHHFIVLDDVVSTDADGIPRRADGQPALIREWGNRVPEAFEEMSASVTSRNWLGKMLQWPMVAAHFGLRLKAKLSTHPLADYGDTPHIYRMLTSQSPEERERIAAEASAMTFPPSHYNIFFHNCEHMCNTVRTGCMDSPLVRFMLWIQLRIWLGLLGLFLFRSSDVVEEVQTIAGLGLCTYSDAQSDLGLGLGLGLCPPGSEGGLPLLPVPVPWHPSAPWAAYHLFTSVPVALQAVISYTLLVRSVREQHRQAIIDTHECHHLLAKELGRAAVVAGLAISIISWAPVMLTSLPLHVLVCTFAMYAADSVFNCASHAVMRLVLLPVWGRVWLLGPPPSAAAAPAAATASLKIKGGPKAD